MDNNQACTIVHNGPSGEVVRLHLEEVKVDALVVDVSAQLTVSHVFTNTSETATGRAKYVFPKPASAAVCAFEMQTSDGGLITGVVMESAQAEARYNAAVDQGKTSSLVKWATDDVFTISVGSIPARTTVITKLSCVMNLMNNNSPDEVRLQIPMAIGPMRYGAPPVDIQGAASARSRTRLRITVRVQTGGTLESVTSPSHENIVLSPYHTHHGRDSNHRITARLRSATFLERDFVAIIKAAGLDEPRCFAERDPQGRGTVALQLVVVPKFEMPPTPPQEYLFLVDRSGSMGSERRIETAKETLNILLHLPPQDGSKINVYSFGTHCDSLWTSQSVRYDQGSMAKVIQHVAGMEADYGGTEIRTALEQVFMKRDVTMPTVLFVLTDGEAYDIDLVSVSVRRAVHSSPPNSPLRVFTLGIGDTASSGMCEAIARNGNGECLMALTTEDILTKFSRLFRMGQSSGIKDVTVEWGVNPAITLNTPNGQATKVAGVNLLPPPGIQQTPPFIKSVYSHERFTVMAIIKAEEIPKQITLWGRLDGHGGDVSLTVPVKLIRFASAEPIVPLIHTIAAHHLIQDTQEERAEMPGVIGDTTPEEIKKAAIVRLGEGYQLVSRHTSFVAVDEGERSQQKESFRQGYPNQQEDGPNESHPQHGPARSPIGENLWMAFNSIVNTFSELLGYSGTSGSNGRTRGRSRSVSPFAQPGDDNDRGGGNGEGGQSEDEGDDREGYESGVTFSTLSTLESFSEEEAPKRLSHRTFRRPPPRKRSPSPQVVPQPQSEQVPAEEVRATLEPIVVELVRLQSSDGSFKLNKELEKIVGQQAIAEASNIPGVDRDIWATAVATAFYQKHLVGQRDMLDGLTEKIMRYVAAKMGKREFDKLVRRAKGLII